MGFASLWVCDHLYGPQSPTIPILEAWSLLAGLAACTTTVELGTLVEVEDEEGYAYTAEVIDMTDKLVTLDFNPPLAGKTLTYDVEVTGVRVSNTMGKTKRFGRYIGKRGDTKRAYVSIKAGQEINFTGE